MLSQPADFPNVGSTCFLKHTAQEARILRHNADRTVLVSLVEKVRAGVSGRAAGNREVPRDEIFPDPETASFGSIKAAARAQRSRAAGRSIPA